MRTWRIVRRAHAAFDGEGTRRYGSRWTPRGLAVVFTSSTLSLAALERFVHADPDLEPDDLLAIPADIPPDVAVHTIDAQRLPPNWREFPAPIELEEFGRRWVTEGRTAVLSVPSVVIPQERNLVLNPGHAAFRRIKAGPAERFSHDPRMCQKRKA